MGVNAAWRSLVVLGVLVTSVGAGTGNAPPPLIDAVKKADLEAVRGLIAQGADVNVSEGDGSTALLWASHGDDLRIVELLVSEGADANAANDLGATPLWTASENGTAEIVEALLSAGADANKALRNGETPLMTASRAGHGEVVEMLLMWGADSDATGPRNQTALMWAASARHPDVVAVLVENGANVHALSETWGMFMAQDPSPHPGQRAWFEHGGNTALMFAARAGDLPSVQHLVAAGANVDTRDAFGISALTTAAYSDFGTLIKQVAFSGGNGAFHLGGRDVFRPGRFTELMEFLLENGADPNLGSGRFTALHTAIMRRDEEKVDLLLKHGANPNIPLQAWTPHPRGASGYYFLFDRAWVGAPPVWLAARFATPYILRRLVEHGGDPGYFHRGEYYRGGEGGDRSEIQLEVSSPLMAAVGMSRTGRAWVQSPGSPQDATEALEKVKLLLDFGVDVNAVDHEGRTALDGRRQSIRPRRQFGAPPDPPDNVDSDFDPVVDLLLSIGAREGDELAAGAR
jgi:ankyrin repeat protein